MDYSMNDFSIPPGCTHISGTRVYPNHNAFLVFIPSVLRVVAPVTVYIDEVPWRIPWESSVPFTLLDVVVKTHTHPWRSYGESGSVNHCEAVPQSAMSAWGSLQNPHSLDSLTSKVFMDPNGQNSYLKPCELQGWCIGCFPFCCYKIPDKATQSRRKSCPS